VQGDDSILGLGDEWGHLEVVPGMKAVQSVGRRRHEMI